MIIFTNIFLLQIGTWENLNQSKTEIPEIAGRTVQTYKVATRGQPYHSTENSFVTKIVHELTGGSKSGSLFYIGVPLYFIFHMVNHLFLSDTRIIQRIYFISTACAGQCESCFIVRKKKNLVHGFLVL